MNVIFKVIVDALLRKSDEENRDRGREAGAEQAEQAGDRRCPVCEAEAGADDAECPRCGARLD